jgi:hypothetical protein
MLADKSLKLKPFLALVVLGVALAWGAERLQAPPVLELDLRLDSAKAQLWVQGEPRLTLPRSPDMNWLSVRFYREAARLESGSPQTLAWSRLSVGAEETVLAAELWEGQARRRGTAWLAEETAELLLTRALPEHGRVRLRVEAATDFALVLGEPGLRQAAAMVLRPLGNELGWCWRKDGRFGLYQVQEPLAPLREQAWWALGAEVLAWSASALGLLALLGLLGHALGALPASRAWVWWRPRWAWLLPVLLGGLLAALSLRLGGEGLAHVTDEISSLFQAQIFAQGRNVAPPPPEPAAFFMEHVIAGPQGWHSKYPPLWSALITPFVTLAWPWLAGPFYGAMAVALLYGFARRVAGPLEAGLAAALLAVSPQFIWMSGSYFNHAAGLMLSVAFLWGAWRGREQGQWQGWAWAALAGAALAFMRPFTAACLGVGLALWALGCGGWRQRTVWLGLAAVALSDAVAVGLSHWMTTGSPWLSPYILYDPMDRPGFGAGLGTLPTWGSFGHDFHKGLTSGAQYLQDLRQRFLGWPLGLSGGFLLLGLGLGAALRRWTRLDGLLAASFLALALGHGLYWGTILMNLGACYWFEGLASLAWLAARGAGHTAAALQAWGVPRARAAMALSIVAGALWAGASLLPQQAWALRGMAKVDGHLAQLLRPLGPSMRALVLVPVVEPFDYNAAFGQQPPFLDGRFVFARSRGPQDDAWLAAQFPSRRVLRYQDGLLLPWERP